MKKDDIVKLVEDRVEEEKKVLEIFEEVSGIELTEDDMIDESGLKRVGDGTKFASTALGALGSIMGLGGGLGVAMSATALGGVGLVAWPVLMIGGAGAGVLAGIGAARGVSAVARKTMDAFRGLLSNESVAQAYESTTKAIIARDKLLKKMENSGDQEKFTSKIEIMTKRIQREGEKLERAYKKSGGDQSLDLSSQEKQLVQQAIQGAKSGTATTLMK